MTDLFESLEPITLDPCQSLPLRRMIDAMKADDSLFDACPEIIQNAITDFMLPPWSSAERHIAALEDCIADDLKLLTKFADKIRDLESRGRTAVAAAKVMT